MRTTTATALAALLGAAVLGCDIEEQQPGPPPAAEQDPALDRDTAGTLDDDPALAIGVDSLDGEAYITDGEGRALYAIEGEPEDRSTCYDDCAEEWPPLLVSQGEPGAASGDVREDLLGTLERQDGDRQVSYAGRALYYYHDDRGPGQTEGHHVMDEWGEWYLVQPDGELLEDGDHEDGDNEG